MLGMWLSSILWVGCSKNDGDWDSIQITVNDKKCKTSSYKVPLAGGEFKIYSKNYGSLWLNSVKENGNLVWPEHYDWTDYKNIHLTNEWYEVLYDKAGNIVVTIQPKDKSTSSRSISLDVESGDAFGSITLLQD